MGFRIKTVAMLTGVSENTLRAWERRYAFVVPTRTDNGYREYSEEDLTQLQSLKRFVDQGYAVREAIELLEEAQGGAGLPGRAPRLAVVHPTLADQLDEVPEAFELVWTGARLEQLPDTPPPGGVDVAVVSLRSLGHDVGPAVVDLRHALGARAVLVVFQFTTHDIIAEVLQAGAQMMRGPVRVEDLQARVAQLVAASEAEHHRRDLAGEQPTAVPEPPRARLLTDAQLARLREQESSIGCECPNHMAALVSSLVAFERYSMDCAVRTPEEAAVHEGLARGTARARAIMEQLVLELSEAEGFEL